MHEIEQPQTCQRAEVLRAISAMCTQLVGARVGLSHRRGCKPLTEDLCLREHELQGDLVLEAFGGLWQPVDELDCGREMVDGLRIRAPCQGIYRRLLQIR